MLFNTHKLFSVVTPTAFAAGLYIMGSSLANSAILYDNLASPTSGADSVNFVGPLANSFSAGVSGFALNDVKVALSGSPDSGSVQVSLLADNATSPGSVLINIGSLSDASLSSSIAVYDFSLASAYSLAPNTRYWLSLFSSDGSSASWAWSLDQSAKGVAGEYFSNQGGLVFSNTNGAYQMSIAAVPEPEEWTLMIVGGTLLVGWQIRRKQKNIEGA